MTTSKITAKAAAMLDELRDRRAAHAAHRRLQRELSAYSRPQEIRDLLALVDTQVGDQAAEVSSILHQNLAQYYRVNAGMLEHSLSDYYRVRSAS